MPFKYSCFISYRHGQQEIFNTFLDQFCKALKSELELLLDLDIYIDHERVSAGAILDKNLASAITNSVCMIFIYTPKYFAGEENYCAREFLIMSELQQHRFEKFGIQNNSFIIPVILRGSKNFPKNIFETEGEIIYADFEKFTLVDSKRIIEHPNFFPQIQNIANHIYECFLEVQFQEPCEVCSKLDFPAEEEAAHWIDVKIKNKQTSFPFRNE